MQRPAWRDTLSALRIHNYRLYSVAQAISYTAGWMQRIAVDWLVLELTGSIALVGLTIALQFLPTLIFGAHAGILADRLPKRAVLLASQGVVGVLSVILAVSAILGTAELWFVYAMVLGIGVMQVVDLPARAVFVQEMVGPRHLRNAISVNASIFHLGALIGPSLAGAIIATAGTGWAIGVNAVAVVIGMVLLLTIRTSELLIAPRAPRERGQIRQAARYIMSKPTIFWTMVLVGVIAIFGMQMPVLLAGMAAEAYNTGATGYGFYNSLVAAGALVGALASTRRSSLRLRTIVFGALLYGLLQLAAGLAPLELMFLALLTTIGLSRLLYMTASETMVQFSTNLAIRGRVVALWVLVVVGGQAIGAPMMGGIAEAFGPRTAMVISGAVPAIAAIAIGIVLAHSGRLKLVVRAGTRGSWVSIVRRAGKAGEPKSPEPKSPEPKS